MRRYVGLVLLILLCSVTYASAAPNIVVILTDDQEDTGSVAYLPKVKALAEQGVTFENSFVNFSLCAPSRSSFFTGQAAHNHGIKSNEVKKAGGWENFRKNEANVLPVWLKAAGYETALMGKYVNGYGVGQPPRASSAAYWANAANTWFGIGSPDKQHWVPPGWDLWYAFTNVSSRPYYDYSINENGELHHFGQAASDYSTDVLKNRAVRFIKDEAGSSAPFFMLIATPAPHGDRGKEPAIPSSAYAQAFTNIKLPTTPAFNEADVSDKPPKIAKRPSLDDAAKDKKDKIEAAYRAELQSLQSVDDLVGAVVDELRAAGKLDNSVIVYTSDNGFEFGDHRLFGKGWPYEGSIKVPLVIKGPGIPQNERRGQLVNNLDVVATIEEIAGLAPGIVPDGRSLMPVLRDGNATWRSAILIEGGSAVKRLSDHYAAIRTATRKYVQYEDGFEELYDLVADPYELENKAHDPNYASDLATLQGVHDQLKSCVGPGCWVP
jgi:N-acetylglucosamine-6-sulfatase